MARKQFSGFSMNRLRHESPRRSKSAYHGLLNASTSIWLWNILFYDLTATRKKLNAYETSKRESIDSSNVAAHARKEGKTRSYDYNLPQTPS